jgi:hypothetical protein
MRLGLIWGQHEISYLVEITESLTAASEPLLLIGNRAFTTSCFVPPSESPSNRYDVSKRDRWAYARCPLPPENPPQAPQKLTRKLFQHL